MSWVTWVFSGIGIAVPIAVISWFISVKYSGRKTVTKQHIRSGNHSMNVQIGSNAEAKQNYQQPT